MIGCCFVAIFCFVVAMFCEGGLTYFFGNPLVKQVSPPLFWNVGGVASILFIGLPWGGLP